MYESHAGNEGDDTGVSISPLGSCNILSKDVTTECPLKNWSVVHNGGVGVFANGGIPRWIGLDDPWLCWSWQECVIDITSDGLANWSPKLFPNGDVRDTGTDGFVIISVGAAPVS